MDEELKQLKLFMLERLSELGTIMSDIVTELQGMDERIKELEKRSQTNL